MPQIFLDSNKVNVYPSAYRGYSSSNQKIIDPESRLMTEANIIKNRLGVQDSFVISGNYPTSQIIECNIHGYWFKLDLTGKSFSNTYVYAKIKLEDKNPESTVSETDYPATALSSLREVSGADSLSINDNYLDDNEVFYGLELVESSTKLSFTAPVYGLLILVNADGYTIPQESRFVIDSSKIIDYPHLEEGSRSIMDGFTTNEIFVKNGSSLGTDGDIHIIGGYIYQIDGQGKYIWWLDKNGNIYQFKSSPQNDLYTCTYLTDAFITWNGSSYEADWAQDNGRRYYCTGSTLEDLDTNAHTGVKVNPYEKVHFVYNDNTGIIHISYNE